MEKYIVKGDIKMSSYDVKIKFSELEAVNNYLNPEDQKEVQELIDKTYIGDSMCYNAQEVERLHKKYFSYITNMKLKESEAINKFVEEFENLLVDHTIKFDYNNKEETKFKKDGYYNAVAAGLVNLCKEYGNRNIYNVLEKIPQEKQDNLCLFIWALYYSLPDEEKKKIDTKL